MKIYLATWLLEKSQGISLSNCGSKKRLLSYSHTKDKKEELSDYVNRPKIDNKK